MQTARELGINHSRRYTSDTPCLAVVPRQFVIDPVGDLYKCAAFAGEKKFSVGSIYNDSIRFNDLTLVSYTIGKDTVSVGLKFQNDQYLYVYTTKEYKNKKSFIKRLFTFDFKKVTKTKYIIHNTNDLIKTDSVRVVEAISK